MIPALCEPSAPHDPELASSWAAYGARQICQMMGLPLVGANSRDDCDTSLIIAPAHNALYVNCQPEQPPPEQSILPLLGFQMQAECSSKGLQDALPVLGQALSVTEGELHGRLVGINGDIEHGALYALQYDESGALRVVFNAPVFETIGLYLSRFSWPNNPGCSGFVRYVDLLWEALPERWRRRPIVAEYLRLMRSIFLRCYEHLDLPMATCWAHPWIDGDIKHHGLVATHDTDSVYEEPQFQNRADQSNNNHFNFHKWRELEKSLGIKSAFYFFSPDPEESYWTDPGYTLRDPIVREAAMELAENGWEIAPHQLGYRTSEEIEAEIAHFEDLTSHAPSGTRNHVLTNAPSTLKWKSGAGLSYDSTWYAEQTETSFLCGTVLPFAPMDAETGQQVGLWEFPFVIEDGIVHGVYGVGQQRTTEEAIEDGRRGLDHILDHHGYACFNWHQRTFARETLHRGEPATWVTALEHLVRYFQKQSESWWNPLPAELADFWTRRSNISIEAEAGKVEIANMGPDDCPDLVVAVQNVAPKSEQLQPLETGDTDIFLTHVSLRAGEKKIVPCRGQ